MPAQFDPDTAAVQQALADVLLHKEIARGGQKLVFHAESQKYGHIAVKLIKPSPGIAEQRADREIEIAKSLRDPRFATMYQTSKVTIGGVEVICIYEEFLSGSSLRATLQTSGRLSVAEAIRVARELLTALQILSDVGVIHRDVKPENVHLTADGRVVLLDLGIARQVGQVSLTDDHAIFGPLTPGYGAPEQIRNEKRRISARTDIFATGVVLYECLSGANPFVPSGVSAAQALRNTLELVPPPLTSLSFSDQLSTAVAQCLEKAAHRRFCSPAEALAQIMSCPEAQR